MLPAETILLAGPTGAGKTDLSLQLAGHLDGEIVGADAFQIYRGLPILTAQPWPSSRGAIPHHLIGTVDPAEAYDAGRYLREALPIIRDIAVRGKRPVVVGGTGLYFKALLGGLHDLPKGDPVLRAELQSSSLQDLTARLQSIDPAAISSIDLANRRRVERALEIVLLTGKPLDDSRKSSTPAQPNVATLLITRNREELGVRIAANVRAMFDQGVENEVAEVTALTDDYVGPTASMTLGLREVRALLRGETTTEEAIASIVSATQKYAKRQLTWFRNQHTFPELNLSLYSDPKEAFAQALQLLASRGS